MFTLKNKYFLIIENTKDIDLSNIKISNKFIIIYRNQKEIKNTDKLMQFRRICKCKKIDFYVANNVKLAKILKSDGLYISAYNKKLNLNNLKNYNFKIIGSAHNTKELNIKHLQGCSSIIFSRLFKTSYKFKTSFLGIIRFNLFKLSRKECLIPLGGINLSNLNKLKLVKSNGFAFMSAIKRERMLNRLF
tara:strand:- start:493 stop:1062 length:570 start_codon:yes stop_codon:yes gene_type:complete